MGLQYKLSEFSIQFSTFNFKVNFTFFLIENIKPLSPLIGANHRIINDRMENIINGCRYRHNLL